MTVHGGDGARIAAAIGIDPAGVLDLSASLNPVAPDVTLIVRRHLDALSRYPDPANAAAALADALGVDRDRLLLTNGGAEAIALVAASLRTGWVDEPDFALYGRHIVTLDPAGPRWRSDPHNPTGRLAKAGETAAVWDEAFYPLATGTWNSRRDASIILGSLTKVFACPGLRIGYVLADPGLIAELSVRQPQWSVNGLVAACLPDLLETADLRTWVKEIARLRADLDAVLRAHGLRPQPADANYVLVPGAAGVRDHLLRSGIVVRDCTSFGLPDHVRIAVPGDEGLARLDAGLQGWT